MAGIIIELIPWISQPASSMTYGLPETGRNPWGYLKEWVYRNRPTTLAQFQENNRNEVNNIDFHIGYLLYRIWYSSVKDTSLKSSTVITWI